MEVEKKIKVRGGESKGRGSEGKGEEEVKADGR